MTHPASSPSFLVRALLLLASVVAAAGCGGDAASPDGGVADTGLAMDGSLDLGEPDAGDADLGVADLGALDSDTSDLGATDGATDDAEVTDLGTDAGGCPDTDMDGVCNEADACTGNDSAGDGDSDGVCNDVDACTGNDGTGDSDTDGFCNDVDMCTGDDAAGDADMDDVCNDLDVCVGDDSTGDADMDGICADTDNCVAIFNPGQEDNDPPTGEGDACNVVFVRAGATGAGDGASWADAFTSVQPAVTAAQANRELLDHGTLYVARFDADGTGRWLPLVHGQGPLTAANGFADQGAVVIKARQASDLLGATRMDRPEWLAIDPSTREVFCTLTNNSARGQPGQPGVDAANPRANNVMGQIIRWVDGDDRDGDFDSTTMRWNHLLLAGDPANARPEAQGNVKGDAFACPDGLAFDTRGVLWIQTDVSSSAMGQGELVRLGNNQMLACDTATGEVRRFLTGPVGCEVTGAAFTPDGRTLFINIQHPGESPRERSDPAAPTRFSTWPDGPGAGRPRSATVVIRKRDGGVIGT